MPTNWAPMNMNSTANSMNTPSAAHCGPNTSRRNTSRKAKAKPSRGNHAAKDAQQTQRRGGQTGHQVVHQINQAHKAVFGIAKFTLRVHHRDFDRPAREGICQNRDKRTAFMAIEHRVDNVAAIGAQHAAVVPHRFTGGALNQAVDHLRRAFTEEGVLAVLPNGTDHVVTFVRLRHQARDLFRWVLQVGIKGNNQDRRSHG
ncbi:Uncharacterised protein [Raoultella ornithinolytica]|nr:Uncharacterised protein [Raoultella ornithinolytica]